MSVRTSVEFMPEIGELEVIQTTIGSISEQGEWTPDLTYQIELIVEELCINVINHGEVDGTQPIRVEIESDVDFVKIEISDNGRAFDPTKDVATPSQITSIENSEIGGWGVHLAHTFSDEMHYRRVDDKNCLTLVKRRTG
ncbi:MAG: ATP-binding protein [Chloroflexi bacterium]|nr:ATP-binding protein [Chloroflexota bacterium]